MSTKDAGAGRSLPTTFQSSRVDSTRNRGHTETTGAKGLALMQLVKKPKLLRKCFAEVQAIMEMSARVKRSYSTRGQCGADKHRKDGPTRAKRYYSNRTQLRTQSVICVRELSISTSCSSDDDETWARERPTKQVQHRCVRELSLSSSASSDGSDADELTGGSAARPARQLKQVTCVRELCVSSSASSDDSDADELKSAETPGKQQVEQQLCVRELCVSSSASSDDSDADELRSAETPGKQQVEQQLCVRELCVSSSASSDGSEEISGAEESLANTETFGDDGGSSEEAESMAVDARDDKLQQALNGSWMDNMLGMAHTTSMLGPKTRSRIWSCSLPAKHHSLLLHEQVSSKMLTEAEQQWLRLDYCKYKDRIVRAKHEIPKDTVICGYVGELISNEEYKQRLKKGVYNDSGRAGKLFEISTGKKGASHYIDVAPEYELASMGPAINHSCKHKANVRPRLKEIVADDTSTEAGDWNRERVARMVQGNKRTCKILSKKGVIFVTTKVIKKNEEVLWEYNVQCDIGDDIWLRCYCELGIELRKGAAYKQVRDSNRGPEHCGGGGSMIGGDTHKTLHSCFERSIRSDVVAVSSGHNVYTGQLEKTLLAIYKAATAWIQAHDFWQPLTKAKHYSVLHAFFNGVKQLEQAEMLPQHVSGLATAEWLDQMNKALQLIDVLLRTLKMAKRIEKQMHRAIQMFAEFQNAQRSFFMVPFMGGKTGRGRFICFEALVIRGIEAIIAYQQMHGQIPPVGLDSSPAISVFKDSNTNRTMRRHLKGRLGDETVHKIRHAATSAAKCYALASKRMNPFTADAIAPLAKMLDHSVPVSIGYYEQPTVEAQTTLSQYLLLKEMLVNDVQSTQIWYDIHVHADTPRFFSKLDVKKSGG
uniref:SET domain-containing protein n=1 Tax=Globodera rostochiensis TaxID=31243 RepID=A0A914I1R3_GLORO